MDCLIIAAGFGSRLRAVSPSKPLTPVAGVPLIERVIRAAAEGGATRFTVATGHEADRLEAFLEALPFEIAPVRVGDWSLPNGHSVLAGAARIAGDYLLTMSDHLFDPEIAAALIAAPPAALRLAVDRDLANPLLDMDDVTKVETGEGGAIVRIGKTLTRFDAADTGLFRATPALAAAIAAGGGSLSDGVQRLADQGQAMTLDVTGRFWLDVDDPAALAKAEARLG
ncbi:NTP transferase domain-containing protein [Allosphingosinicella sp.]|uniref:phosphocholine cytidylyltransferase family protein n=1 Tax=Allosphingosinicella sp. TaxID=2823234 RepID=UPI003784F2F0